MMKIQATCTKCLRKLEVPIETDPKYVICNYCCEQRTLRQKVEGYDISSGEYMKNR
jgi:hypothetical protein